MFSSKLTRGRASPGNLAAFEPARGALPPWPRIWLVVVRPSVLRGGSWLTLRPPDLPVSDPARGSARKILLTKQNFGKAARTWT